MCHKLGRLKQQKYILSTFQRPEIPSQGVDRVILSLQTLGKKPIHPFSLWFWFSWKPLLPLACDYITLTSASIIITWYSPFVVSDNLPSICVNFSVSFSYLIRTQVFFIAVLEVHCGIYKSSYNMSTISYLNSPLHHSPLSPLLYSWNSFSRSHFSIYIHVYTVFVSYSPSYTLSPHCPLPTGTNPQTGQRADF
jgi:hypothetical protein